MIEYQLTSHLKYFISIDSFKSRSLEMLHSQLILSCKFLSFFIRDLLLVTQITLCADYHLGNTFLATFIKSLIQCNQFLQAIFLCGIVNEYDSICSFVICLCDSVKSLLANSVPDWQSDLNIADLDFFYLKIHCNCSLETSDEFII